MVKLDGKPLLERGTILGNKAQREDDPGNADDDNLVHIDTLITDKEKVDFNGEAGRNKVARRANNIAIKAYEFLRKMKVTNESMFSNASFWQHKRIRANITDDIINQRRTKPR